MEEKIVDAILYWIVGILILVVGAGLGVALYIIHGMLFEDGFWIVFIGLFIVAPGLTGFLAQLVYDRYFKNEEENE